MFQPEHPRSLAGIPFSNLLEVDQRTHFTIIIGSRKILTFYLLPVSSQAEMPDDHWQKNKLSHRYKALEKRRAFLLDHDLTPSLQMPGALHDILTRNPNESVDQRSSSKGESTRTHQHLFPYEPIHWLVCEDPFFLKPLRQLYNNVYTLLELVHSRPFLE